jgi:transposase, IS5 family
LEKVLPKIESQIGVNLNCIVADAGYKGHNAPEKHKLKVFTSGQKRGVTDSIKKALRRRAAVEPVIGHLKAEHRMGRNYLAGHTGDAINAVLAAVGYNFSLLLKWLSLLFAFSIAAIMTEPETKPA